MGRESIDAELVVPAGTVVAVAADGPRFETLEDVAFAPGQGESSPIPVAALASGEDSNVATGLVTEVEGIAGISSVSNPGPMAGGAPDRAWLYGILLAIAVGLVILGGIKSIGRVASVIVPVMCGVYVLAGLWIIITNMDHVVFAVQHIVSEAFTPEAGRGGLIGVLIQGFRRAAFSNEAGVGSASIAHSAATTKEPVREGIVALLEPFIDTIIVCSMTGIVVVITGAYQMDVGNGVLMTSAAFGSVLDWFPLVLSFAVVMFAFSTMISWSYYGERCATWLLGEWASMPYKLLFLACVFFGSVFKLGNVLDFSDLMVLGMAFPNILGLLLLSGKVKAALDDYWSRLKSGTTLPS
ncbi:MAG: alanine:cation symporter family protein [Alphaproteobacteria bacterium]|nr:alanine:cation symporter family protein [Alphaproteobacteria bacterium]